ncbi:MAG: YbaK/EbsC family protein [Desulfovibrio sp.]|jgi:prolyl-tRNA editing enzyme YbaK/EbsC (Cys-tRNA(Pro) deacylase)|nr:YbaK/EbsC family protein [Desulfovibrio sp.]
MSFERVKEYFERVGLGQRVVEREHIGATVEQAALSIGCEPERIAKTMSFLVAGGPALVVMAGDAKVNNSKFKACFHQKAVMLPSDQVATRIGHEPGAVCPFALNEGISVFLDESLKRFNVVYTAGGSVNSTVELAMEELVQHSAPAGWVDVCNGWNQ